MKLIGYMAERYKIKITLVNMIKHLFLILLTTISSKVFCQNETTNQITEFNHRVGFSVNLSLVPRRIITSPTSVFKSEFYRENFGVIEAPTRTISDGTAMGHFGLNYAHIPEINSQNMEIELGIDFGIQSGFSMGDNIYKRFINSDTSYLLAEIKLNYKIREIFTGGYFLIKGKNRAVNPFLGIGVNYYFSVGSVEVSNFNRNVLVSTFDTKIDPYSNFSWAVPFGLEFPFARETDRYLMKTIGAIRTESHNNDTRVNRFFLTASFQFQYKF